MNQMQNEIELNLSDEERKRRSDFAKQRWNDPVYRSKMCRPLSEVTKDKISKQLEGRKKPPRSEEHCRNISLAKLGKKTGPRSEETRRKIGNGQKGRTHVCSEETRKKLSSSCKTSLLIAHADPTKYVNHPQVKGKFFSTKNGKDVPYRSTFGELTYIKWLERNPEVSSYEYEPVRISYFFEGQKHITIPDFLVHYTDGHTELVEVKMEWKVQNIQEQLKIEAVKRYAMEHNWIFRLVLGKDLDLIEV